ncbi:hypothetical protein [Cupriavidus necator]|uniref:hypothetical protein n=1 Tax=Cupriavidus necator TaxID=106590 RepID=UPI0009941EC8|nr:hypothetical protein [Cupriavidus necator]
MHHECRPLVLVALLSGLASTGAFPNDSPLTKAIASVQAAAVQSIDEQLKTCGEQCSRLLLLKDAMLSAQCEPSSPAIVLSASLMTAWVDTPMVSCAD